MFWKGAEYKMRTDIIDIGTAMISYKIIGSGIVDVVVEMGLGSCIAEWQKLAGAIAQKGHTVLLYERAGCGYSTPSRLKRTPENIVKELHCVLDKLETTKKITIIAHSQGGLYSQVFARLYTDRVERLILLDPLSANDNKFKELLTADEYRKSGVDKFASLGIQRTMAKLHLGFVIKKIMKNAPPFYYYRDFTNEEEKYILSTLVKPTVYETAMQEYQLSHDENVIQNYKNKKDFPDIEIILITHSSDFCIKETMEFGGATREVAEKVENIWQDIMKEYLQFSKKAKFLQAKECGHYIHLMCPELVIEQI